MGRGEPSGIRDRDRDAMSSATMGAAIANESLGWGRGRHDGQH